MEFAKCGLELAGRLPLYGDERGLGEMEEGGFVGVLSLNFPLSPVTGKVGIGYKSSRVGV